MPLNSAKCPCLPLIGCRGVVIRAADRRAEMVFDTCNRGVWLLPGLRLLVILVMLFVPSMAEAQRFEPVQQTARHEQIRAMASEIINRSDRVSSFAIQPEFYTCNQGHLHWRLGSSGIFTDSLPMRERLEIEWFNKQLTPQQRRFWTPYFREIDSQIDDFIRSPQAQNDDAQQELENKCAAAIGDIYRKGVNAYAQATGTQPVEGVTHVPCCAAAQITTQLIANNRNVAAIKWIDAGTVWLKVLSTGQEPEYHTLTPGTRVQVSPGAFYYYKLVTYSGRETQRLLAPAISEDSDQLVLAWR